MAASSCWLTELIRTKESYLGEPQKYVTPGTYLGIYVPPRAESPAS
jgi:hypothetical protein